MMEEDPHDELWKLLGRARRPQVSPFFARNVVREVRRQHPARLAPFLLRLAPPMAAVLMVAAIGVFMTERKRAGIAENGVEQIVSSPDYELIAELDDLLASEQSAAWLDVSNTF